MWFIAYPGHSYIYETPTDFFQSPWYLFFCIFVVVHVLNVCFTIVCEIRIRYKQVCVCSMYIYFVYEYIYHIYINVIFIFGLWIDWCVNTHVCHIVIVVVPHVHPHTHTKRCSVKLNTCVWVVACFLSYFCICIFIFVWHKV